MASSLRIIPEPTRAPGLPWSRIAWFGFLLLVCYAPVLKALVSEWADNPDMGHGFFVPAIAGYIVWQRRNTLADLRLRPAWWGLWILLAGGLQLLAGTLGVELFTARTAFILSIVGVVCTLGGWELLKNLAFPLMLLVFMVPIPAIVYNLLTFPLQILASKLANATLLLLGIPVLREGNVLELPSRSLSVVEACSGIRSLLSLTFLSLVYGYFFEKRMWMRAVLLAATIPIAIFANSFRVTVTGILSQIKPELSEGFFHESTGWVIFMFALATLLIFHKGVSWLVALFGRKESA